MNYNDTVVGLANRNDVNKERTRYVFCIGDHIADVDKVNFRSLGATFGGLWVGHSETEGCPTMKRTNFMLYRGGITPLETTAIPKKADHRAQNRQGENFLQGEGVPAGVRGYMVYAGDDLNFLQSDKYRPMGVVELQALRFKNWRESNAALLQLLMFPRWNDWLSGIKAPSTLEDWMGEVTGAFNRHPELRAFENDIFESHRLFRNYALAHIERNRQQILAKRSVDNGGMFVSWSGTSQLYARQLNVTLENEQELRPAGAATATGDSALIREMQEERKLRQEEARQNRELITMLAAMLQDRGGAPVPFVTAEQVAPPLTQEVEVETVQENPADHVSFGVDPESVGLSEPDPVVQSPENNPERRELEAALEDPNFALAVEEDEGLRGVIKNNPNLVGAIEEEE